jgi:hypothetical protein
MMTTGEGEHHHLTSSPVASTQMSAGISRPPWSTTTSHAGAPHGATHDIEAAAPCNLHTVVAAAAATTIPVL